MLQAAIMDLGTVLLNHLRKTLSYTQFTIAWQYLKPLIESKIYFNIDFNFLHKIQKYPNSSS